VTHQDSKSSHVEVVVGIHLRLHEKAWSFQSPPAKTLLRFKTPWLFRGWFGKPYEDNNE